MNGTARAVLGEYLPTLPTDSTWLFISNKQETLPDGSKHPAPLTERGLGYLVAKYAQLAKSEDLSPHDLRHRFGYRMAQTVLLGPLPPARVRSSRLRDRAFSTTVACWHGVGNCGSSAKNSLQIYQ